MQGPELVRAQGAGAQEQWTPVRRTAILVGVITGAMLLTVMSLLQAPQPLLRSAQLAQLASQVGERGLESKHQKYDDQTHDAIHDIIGDSWNQETEVAPQGEGVEEGGEVYYNGSTHTVANDYPGFVGMLDSFAIMDVDSETVVKAAEYVFARINQDRALCGKESFHYYEVVSAEAALVGAGGIRFWLRLKIDHEQLGDFLVERLPDYEEHITTSSLNSGLIPQLLGHYHLLHSNPSPCPAASSSAPESSVPEPSDEKDIKDPQEEVKEDGEVPKGDSESAEESGAQGQKGEEEIKFPQDAGNSTENISNSSIQWPPEEEDINKQQVAWKAGSYDQFRHMTLDEFKRTRLGFKAPSKAAEAIALSQTTILSVEGMPDSYDASDRFNCRAFKIQDQGSCGSCYAFAAASALSVRLCAASGGQYDVNLSPQHMVSCNGEDGCEGGNAQEVYEPMYESGRVSDWCMPYSAKDSNDGGPACHKACSEGQRFEVEPDSIGLIQNNVDAIQAEVLLNGPVFAAFYIYPDFMSYKSGVYSASDDAKKQGKVGGHAAMLIGWGTDADSGEDYWLLQNSWSKNWGDNGRFKIRRGTDECELESFGVWFATPEIPKQCGAKKCDNGGNLLKDCGCKCSDGWKGAYCDECATRCSEGGKLDPRSCTCVCRPGFSGPNCEVKMVVDNSVACVGSEARRPTVSWDIEAESLRFVPGGYFQVFPKGVEPWTARRGWAKASSNPLRICGEKDEWAVGKTCESQGQFELPELSAGEYTVWYAKYLGNNEFGVSRGYKQPLTRVWPDIKITNDCGSVASEAHVVAEQCVEAAEKEWWQEQEKTAEQASERKRRAETAEQAALSIKAPAPTTLDAPDVVFGSLPIEYSIPDWKDSEPPSNKEFGLFPEGETESWYPLGTVDGKRQGSLNFEVSGVPPGKYKLAMFCMGSQAASRQVVVGDVGLTFQYSYNAVLMKVKVSWARKPSVIASKNMWLGLFQKGASASEPLQSYQIKAGAEADGTIELELEKGGDVGPGSNLEVKMFLSDGAPISAGELQWP